MEKTQPVSGSIDDPSGYGFGIRDDQDRAVLTLSFGMRAEVKAAEEAMRDPFETATAATGHPRQEA